MKRRIAIVVGGVVAAVGLAVAPTVVQAEPPADTGGVVPNQKDLQKIADYWTPERMEAAKPKIVRAPHKIDPMKVAKGKPKVYRGTLAAQAEPRREARVDDELGGPWTGGGKVVNTTGKVFFTMGGLDYVCSASVVPAENKSTVSTAGHCVNDAEEQDPGTPGTPAENFAFVPAYDNGNAPLGVWPATNWTAHTLWIANRGDGSEKWNYDVGFAQIAPLEGKYLEDVTGSQSIAFNQKRGQNLVAFGYPAEDPYDGETLQYCAGEAADDEYGGSNDQMLKCSMTGGSSGGPWFQEFDEKSGVGVQTSVNSFGYTGVPNEMYGPYFGTAIQRLYEAVQD